jgi:hypothetical protein
MVIIQDKHRFELSVNEFYGEWLAVLREYIPGRFYPTVHVLRTLPSRETAIASLCRKWRVLFPEQSPLVWREPTIIRAHWRTDRHRAGSGRKARRERGQQ